MTRRINSILTVLVVLLPLLSGCPVTPRFINGEPTNPLHVYPPEGMWVLEREPHVLITAYDWDGNVIETTVPFSQVPTHPVTGEALLRIPSEDVIISDATFTIHPEYYTQGTLSFNPPLAGEVSTVQMWASRTAEETQYVRDHGPTANFSSWIGDGPALELTPTNATTPYEMTYGVGSAAPLFGCDGREDMGWYLYWKRGQPWRLMKTYLVMLLPRTAETPPGSCGPGLERLAMELRDGSLAPENLWRQLDNIGAFGADRNLLSELYMVAIEVRYTLLDI